MHTQSALMRELADECAILRQRIDLRDDEIRRLRRQLHLMELNAGHLKSEVHVLRQQRNTSIHYDAQGDY